MVLSSYAKINLSLRINSKRKDGLHEIQSYFCLINLSDKINLKKIKEKKDKIFFKGPFSKLVNKNNNSISKFHSWGRVATSHLYTSPRPRARR